ncbi:isoprenylcysteine carboxylmethyltransferase family protein [bacterium]|nr:MAG: isoprenylcysteine carboxylmethyltransferase family protein [bacterium]
MKEQNNPNNKRFNRISANSAIVFSFIVALEIVIMISPFAFYFYAVFNPFLLALNQSSITRWLTAFFLPHMVVPPNGVLTIIRILGSVFFVAGVLVFLVCAGQVYLGKLFKRGAATKGLYTLIRHPQYVGLAFAALGLAIMWPRFLTLFLLSVMLLLYYILAKDEERRMINRFGEGYAAYMNRTGMFVPLSVEKLFIKNRNLQKALSLKKVGLIFLGLVIVIVGSGFILRAYTVRHLPFEQVGTVDVITITSDDFTTVHELLPAVLGDSVVASKLKALEGTQHHRLLAYFIPIDYVMQGMIANTGDEWKLFEQHKTIGMITKYILHPFVHLTGGHAHHMDMANMKHGPEMYASPAMKRRVIFIDISSDRNELKSSLDDFDINTKRTPLFFVDVHLHTAEILQVRDTPTGSGWGTVPTPMF